MLLASPALGDAVLPIGGAFGNEAGCDYFMTGARAGDNLVILTPDTFTTAAAGCYFETLVSPVPGAYEVSASCHEEGESETVKSQLKVRGTASEGFTVALADSEWGPLQRCPGTEDLFAPLGIAV